MITYQKQQVDLVAVDQALGEATIRLVDGRFRVVPIGKLDATHGWPELIQLVRQCEERQRREQEATR